MKPGRNFVGSEVLRALGYVCCLLHVGFFLSLPFDPDDGSDVFIQNIG
jgi:hypothetical protein